MKTRKQKIFLALKILAVVLVAIVIALFAFREALLKQTIAKVSFEMASEYNSDFSIKKASFVGISGLFWLPKMPTLFLRFKK
jgi:cell division septal protein FtsQ